MEMKIEDTSRDERIAIELAQKEEEKLSSAILSKYKNIKNNISDYKNPQTNRINIDQLKSSKPTQKTASRPPILNKTPTKSTTSQIKNNSESEQKLIRDSKPKIQNTNMSIKYEHRPKPLSVEPSPSSHKNSSPALVSVSPSTSHHRPALNIPDYVYSPSYKSPSSAALISQHRNRIPIVSSSPRSQNYPLHLNGQDMSYEALLKLDEDMYDKGKGFNKFQLSRLIVAEFQSNELKIQCSVCLCELKNGEKFIILCCLHQFHEKCIIEWLSRRKECPVCKYEPKF